MFQSYGDGPTCSSCHFGKLGVPFPTLLSSGMNHIQLCMPWRHTCLGMYVQVYTASVVKASALTVKCISRNIANDSMGMSLQANSERMQIRWLIFCYFSLPSSMLPRRLICTHCFGIHRSTTVSNHSSSRSHGACVAPLQMWCCSRPGACKHCVWTCHWLLHSLWLVCCSGWCYWHCKPTCPSGSTATFVSGL